MSFTGSSQAGKIIGEMAGRNLKKSVLELGGLDGCLVMRDAPIDQATDIAIQSRLANAG